MHGGIKIMDTEIIRQICVVIGTPILRSGIGWAEKALEDRRVTRFEVRKLVQTTLRVGLIAVAQLSIVKGLQLDVGMVEAFAISGSTILTDKLFGAIRDTNNVTKR